MTFALSRPRAKAKSFEQGTECGSPPLYQMFKTQSRLTKGTFQWRALRSKRLWLGTSATWQPFLNETVETVTANVFYCFTYAALQKIFLSPLHTSQVRTWINMLITSKPKRCGTKCAAQKKETGSATFSGLELIETFDSSCHEKSAYTRPFLHQITMLRVMQWLQIHSIIPKKF